MVLIPNCILLDGLPKQAQVHGMDKPASPPFRAHIRVLAERSRPDPINVVAWTGVDFWLRVEVPPDVLVRSPGQKRREVGRMIREHYAVWGKRRGPFGRITGYVFQSLPDRATRYDLGGIATGEETQPTRQGEVSLGPR